MDKLRENKKRVSGPVGKTDRSARKLIFLVNELYSVDSEIEVRSGALLGLVEESVPDSLCVTIIT